MAINLSGMIRPETLAAGVPMVSSAGLANQYEDFRKKQQDNQLLAMNVQNEPAKQQRAANEDARLNAQSARLDEQGARQDALGQRQQTELNMKVYEWAAKGVIAAEGNPQMTSPFINQLPPGEVRDMALDQLARGDFAGLRAGAEAMLQSLAEPQEQQETFRSATQEELAALGPGVTGAQVSEKSNKMTNVQRQTDSSTKREIIEGPNGNPRFVDDGKKVFPDVEISKETGRNLTEEAGVRKEFNTLVKDFNKVSDAYARVKASEANPSPAGDMALIFNFMKMLDPSSVVRESEYRTAGDAGALADKLAQKGYDQIVSGRSLSPTQRKDFVDRSNRLYQASRSQAQKTADAFTIIAENAGIDAENIIANFTARANEEPLPPEGYTVIDE